MRDQTVGSNSREGGAWPGKQGKLGIAIDWVTSRLTLEFLQSWLNVQSGPHKPFQQLLASVALCDQWRLKRHPWEARRLSSTAG